VSGLALSRFSFEGFLPRTSSARKSFFEHKLSDSSTWAFYESSHRIQACLEDMITVFPSHHTLVIAREITKLHETIVKDSLAEILLRVRSDENMRKGEFVVVVEGMQETAQDNAVNQEEIRILSLLLKECSIKTAAALAADITGQRKNLLYQAALEIQSKT
jgi:16S rRNA (cytidine1402-2'-O)-methyltransferase